PPPPPPPPPTRERRGTGRGYYSIVLCVWLIYTSLYCLFLLVYWIKNKYSSISSRVVVLILLFNYRSY
ncbi:hypothetical protein PP707_03845, partial [Acetobacter pasteurianus]|nr:hypothetical protein [Acetobacter pasteurianus]